jgi:hypothetical protein
MEVAWWKNQWLGVKLSTYTLWKLGKLPRCCAQIFMVRVNQRLMMRCRYGGNMPSSFRIKPLRNPMARCHRLEISLNSLRSLKPGETAKCSRKEQMISFWKHLWWQFRQTGMRLSVTASSKSNWSPDKIHERVMTRVGGVCRWIIRMLPQYNINLIFCRNRWSNAQSNTDLTKHSPGLKP